MHKFTTAATFLSAAALAHAAIVPTAPYGGVVDRSGQPCDIQYNLDTTGTWSNFTIELMTGDNFHMVHLDTVATGLDGTTGDGKYSWTCPEVTINAAIYFYQFTLNGADPTWTTRFTIAAADGTTVDAPNATQSDGKAIPWGTGALVGAPSDGGVAPVASTGRGSSGASSALTAIPSSSGTTSRSSGSSSSSTTSTSSSARASTSDGSSASTSTGDETTIVTVTPSTTSTSRSRMSSASTTSSAASGAGGAGTAAQQSGSTSNSTTSSASSKQGSSIAGLGLALALLAGAIFVA